MRALAIALGFFLIVRSFLIEAFRIPTGSMENTLLAGDFLLVNKAVFGARVPRAGVALPALTEPVRDDIVIFDPDHDPRPSYLKRIIGVPGDTREMRGKVVYRNEQLLAASYARGLLRRAAIRGEPLVVYVSVAPTRAAQPGARGIRWSRIGHTVH
ncbi:MAG TPA: signal peptidase I [Longimicrobiales bacterium]|nr:signal peptidase I [Longimicrobiales bacterium]